MKSRTPKNCLTVSLAHSATYSRTQNCVTLLTKPMCLARHIRSCCNRRHHIKIDKHNPDQQVRQNRKDPRSDFTTRKLIN